MTHSGPKCLLTNICFDTNKVRQTRPTVSTSNCMRELKSVYGIVE